MKTYQIDANGNALLLVKVEGDKIEILNGMGWTYRKGCNCKVDEM